MPLPPSVVFFIRFVHILSLLEKRSSGTVSGSYLQFFSGFYRYGVKVLF